MIAIGPHVPVRRITPAASSVGDLFRRRAKATPNAPAMYEYEGGAWRATTWGGFYDRARRAARFLVHGGIEKGDRVAILGPTHAPWAVFDMAAQLVGAVSFGIYPQQTPEQVRYLLEHSEAKVVFVSGADELRTVLAAARDLPSLTTIVPWESALVGAAAERRTTSSAASPRSRPTTRRSSSTPPARPGRRRARGSDRATSRPCSARRRG
jgi:long-chain acyl-CoA synthetase